MYFETFKSDKTQKIFFHIYLTTWTFLLHLAAPHPISPHPLPPLIKGTQLSELQLFYTQANSICLLSHGLNRTDHWCSKCRITVASVSLWSKLEMPFWDPNPDLLNWTLGGRQHCVYNKPSRGWCVLKHKNYCCKLTTSKLFSLGQTSPLKSRTVFLARL